MSVVLFDEPSVWKSLLPLTFTRPVSEIRVGILTIREKWEHIMREPVSYRTQDHLQKKFPLTAKGAALHINACICPDSAVIKAVKAIANGETLVAGSRVIAYRGEFGKEGGKGNTIVRLKSDPIAILKPWDIFRRNAEAIKLDFDMLTKNRLSLPVSRNVTVIGKKSQIFMEVGARAEACILNTTDGPIYLGKGAEIMEGSAVRGPFALGAGSQVKMSSKIYGSTTIGPQCKVGGEVNNSVIFGYTNKAHDGFLGNSVVGEWCNLGADTNNSNLKNNYANVKVYDYASGKMDDSGLQFCGLFMGDHSKCGINTMFNTGTVVGVGCNVFGGGFPPTHVPDFSWGGSDGFSTYDTVKLFETAERVFERRQMKFTATEKAILKKVFDLTAGSRK